MHSLLNSHLGENPYATLVAQVRDFAILFVDLKGHIVSWNDGARLLFGYEAEEIIGQPFRRLFVEEDQLSGVPELELTNAKASGRAEDVRWHQCKDGSRFWANGVTTSIHDDKGNLRGFAKIAKDDTARKQAEDERQQLLHHLEFERGRLAEIFHNDPAFVAVLRGSHHTFEMCNPAYYRLVGERDIIGKPFLEALPEIEEQGFVELLNGVLSSGEKIECHEVPIQLQRAPYAPLEERFINLLYLPLREADGSISGVFAHGFDVTEQVNSRHELEIARQQAEEANRIKDQFMATLSHELRTPLNAILGWANILRLHEMDYETQQSGLETIERNARAQAQLIEDLLDVSRILTGKMRLELRAVELSQLVSEAVNNVVPSAQTKDIRIETNIDYSTGLISGDPDRLGQVLWNLLSNAIKFTSKGGKICVTVERAHSSVQVRVSDTGKGMGADFLPHVFERFRQADASSKRAYGGLGIGLALVRHLTEAHGGTVQADSPGEGQGSTFSLCFPLMAVRPEVAKKVDDNVLLALESMSLGHIKLPPLSGLRLLVVDDEADARTLLRIVLTQRGAHVEVAGNAQDALTQIQQSLATSQPFDVLVSDIGMPGEDGHSLIRRVRALEAENGGFLPAIALTAYASHKDRVESLLSGFQIHVTKPVDAPELVASIASLKGRIGNNGRDKE